MSCTYTFNEIIQLIDEANQQEITILCSLVKEEKLLYTPFQLRVIAAAINIQLDYLQTVV